MGLHSHLDSDHVRCVSQQVAPASLQLLAQKETPGGGLQPDHQRLAAPPEGVAAVRGRHGADHFLQEETRRMSRPISS